MGREHFWPIWLIQFANVRRDGVRWINGPNINPRAATLPLCNECNHRLGAELEGPVSQLLPQIEAGHGLSDLDAERLVRWMWKFEALAWAFQKLDEPEWRYSDRWTIVERILDIPLGQLRQELVLAIGLAHRNDEGHADWPMGIDSGLSDHDAICVSGVFKNIALIVSLKRFSDQIPNCYSIYSLLPQRGVENSPVFYPVTCFPTCANAVTFTTEVSIGLKDAHERFAKTADNSAQRIVGFRPRVIIPN